MLQTEIGDYGPFFALLTLLPPTPNKKPRKIRILKKIKKIVGDIIILHIGTVPQTRKETDRVFNHFKPFLALPPLH